jgi:DNA-binding transcriptional regulator YiaG
MMMNKTGRTTIGGDRVSLLLITLPRYQAVLRMEVRVPLNSRGRRAFLLSFFRHLKPWFQWIGYDFIVHNDSDILHQARDFDRPLSLAQAQDISSKLGRFGFEIRIARLKIGQTQKEFARTLGISRSYLSDIENGRKHPSERLLIQFKRILSSQLGLSSVAQRSTFDAENF